MFLYLGLKLNPGIILTKSKKNENSCVILVHFDNLIFQVQKWFCHQSI